MSAAPALADTRPRPGYSATGDRGPIRDMRPQVLLQPLAALTVTAMLGPANRLWRAMAHPSMLAGSKLASPLIAAMVFTHMLIPANGQALRGPTSAVPISP